MDLVEFEKIKRLAVVAMVSDDGLLERLVLKGGNAIDLIYHISSRASKDIDFSMSAEFSDKELKGIRDKVDLVLRSTFHPEGWQVFDVTFTEKPDLLDKQQQTFWGGYRIGFKIASESVYMVNSRDIEYLRRTATITVPHNQRIKDHREFHRPDFISVANTVKSGVQLKDFDFYFDYVAAKIAGIAF